MIDQLSKGHLYPLQTGGSRVVESMDAIPALVAISIKVPELLLIGLNEGHSPVILYENHVIL